MKLPLSAKTLGASGSSEDAWQVLQAPSPCGSCSDGAGAERKSLETDESRSVDEKSRAGSDSWEFVQRLSSGPGSSRSPTGGSGCGAVPEMALKCTDKAPQRSSGSGSGGKEDGSQQGCGGSDTSCDKLVEEFAGAGGMDATGSCNYGGYPQAVGQDSMEIDAMLAQELGLGLVTACGSSSTTPRGGLNSCGSGDAPIRSQACGSSSTTPRGRLSTPSVFEQALSMFEKTVDSMMQAPHLPISTCSGTSPLVGEAARTTRVPSLKSFLDADIPKFPFASTDRANSSVSRIGVAA